MVPEENRMKNVKPHQQKLLNSVFYLSMNLPTYLSFCPKTASLCHIDCFDIAFFLLTGWFLHLY